MATAFDHSRRLLLHELHPCCFSPQPLFLHLLSTISDSSSGSSSDSSGSDDSDDDAGGSTFAILGDVDTRNEPAEASAATSQPQDSEPESVQGAPDGAVEPDQTTQDPNPETLWTVGAKNTLKAGQRIT